MTRFTSKIVRSPQAVRRRIGAVPDRHRLGRVRLSLNASRLSVAINGTVRRVPTDKILLPLPSVRFGCVAFSFGDQLLNDLLSLNGKRMFL